MKDAHGVRPCGCGSDKSHLTRREVDVLLLVAADYEDGEIAAELGISVSTVQTHVKSLRRKADVRHRSGLIMRCYAAGVLVAGRIPPEWSGKICFKLKWAVCQGGNGEFFPGKGCI
jgi:DNA-binding CsgD family transcriptional regulator